MNFYSIEQSFLFLFLNAQQVYSNINKYKMEDFLENLKEALKENPDLVLEIPVKMERMSEDELAELFEDDISDNKEVTENSK